jgi:signal peptidase II|tara:strand:- start:254 stop:724 length:471 start_codon:yes stop_codon:yes gene_type:complete
MRVIPRFFLVTTVIILDQWSKNLAKVYLQEYERWNLSNFIDLTLIYNKGIAFSMFDYESGMQVLPLIILTLAAISFFIFLLIKDRWSLLEEIGILFLIGGAIGNLIDRILQGSVTDFILVYYNNFYFPAFNFADSFITIGILLLLSMELLNKKNNN